MANNISEVVERLAKEIADELLHKWPSSILTDEYVKKHIAEIVSTHATAILHSWREKEINNYSCPCGERGCCYEYYKEHTK